MRIQINPTSLAVLRDMLSSYSVLILDGRLVRETYDVGRHGSRVSPDMEKDLRARGIELWPHFSLRSQNDVVLVHAGQVPPEHLGAGQEAVHLLNLRSPRERALGHAPRDHRGMLAMALYLQMRLEFVMKVAKLSTTHLELCRGTAGASGPSGGAHLASA